MRVLDAFETVRSRTTENAVGGEGGGLTVVLEQLGIDPDDMEASMPSVFYEHTVINMPVPSQLVAAFAAGAVYTRANHSSFAGAVVTEEMITMVHETIDNDYGEYTDGVQRGMIRDALLAALGGPAAGPPADDGAGAS